MTSPPHILYNTFYHIYNRGINGENIFVQERNYSHFLILYTKYIDPISVTYAYCLLRNHFHLLVRIKSEEEITKRIYPSDGISRRSPANIPDKDSAAIKNSGLHVNESATPNSLSPLYPSKQFSNFFNAYAKAINASYGRTGSLFQHPFGRIVIKDLKQFYRVVRYIHQNPQKHGLIDNFREWKYSSYGIPFKAPQIRPKPSVLLYGFNDTNQYINMHNEWVDEEISKSFAGDDND
jgi:putative transposase